MVQIWERCKPLQLISPVNTDHAIFIWRRKPVTSKLCDPPPPPRTKIKISDPPLSKDFCKIFISPLLRAGGGQGRRRGCVPWTQWLGILLWKTIFYITEVRDETFRNGKRYKDKAVSHPPKSMGGLFAFLSKKLWGVGGGGSVLICGLISDHARREKKFHKYIFW